MLLLATLWGVRFVRAVASDISAAQSMSADEPGAHVPRAWVHR
jgi:hypothetical protein